MSQRRESIGVCVPEIFLPAEAVDKKKWACVACDQYTSQPEYWEQTEALVGTEPSTLRLMLPEIYLGQEDEQQRIEKIQASMKEYLEQRMLVSRGEGLVYLERTAAGRMRRGLMAALDLERYDYRKGSQTLIRATEGTILERIPPRLRVRRGAPLEMPHIIILIDDPKRTVIEPLAEEKDSLEPLYDTELMQEGGHLQGWMLREPSRIEKVLDALEALAGSAEGPALLFALGDGNHSFATAKAGWEEIKKDLSPEEQENHPARYALVELENVHDAGIIFEPIHRVLFGVKPEEFLAWLEQDMKERNAEGKGGRVHEIPYVTAAKRGTLRVAHPASQLEAGTLQNSLDAYLAQHPEVRIDYVHGDEVAERLGSQPDSAAFLLPPMAKEDLFPAVIRDGALPRKTFSMGEAREKRYYMECRKIRP